MSSTKTPTGKRRLSFSIREAYQDMPLTVPCGKCLDCRLQHASKWAVRCTHEASLWPVNSFITLTYRELPPNGSLQPRDFTLFMKKLRKSRSYKIRFLQAGEYGKLGRPHHHALLFNCDFPDKYPFKKTKTGSIIYRSHELEKLWNHGFSSIGTVTTQSAAYVARYTVKKAATQADPLKIPEYITMSRRPGIGAGWLKKYLSDVYPTDEVITIDGRRHTPPRYYDETLRLTHPRIYAMVKLRRTLAASNQLEERTSERMHAKRINQERRTTDYLQRSLA